MVLINPNVLEEKVFDVIWDMRYWILHKWYSEHQNAFPLDYSYGDNDITEILIDAVREDLFFERI